MRPLPTFLAAFCAAAMLCDHRGRAAEIILDDFVDPVRIESPEMFEEVVVTDNVGDLGSLRRLVIAGTTLATPNAGMHITGDEDPSLLLDLDGFANTTPGRTPRISSIFEYEFASTDVTDNGQNNAIIVDFDYLKGPNVPLFLDVLVTDSRDGPALRYSGIVGGFEVTDSSFQAVFPFADFTLRGGGQGTPDATSLRLVTLRMFDSGDIANAEWHARISRVRFGRVVPEPNSCLLLLVGGLIATVRSLCIS